MREGESRKRFELSAEGFAVEKMSRLRQAAAEIQLRYPEVIGFTLFGSLTKGTAHPESDVGAYVYVDAEAVARRHSLNKAFETRKMPVHVEHENPSVFKYGLEFCLDPEIEDEYEERLGESFNKAGLPMEDKQGNWLNDIFFHPISEEIIYRFVSVYGEDWAKSRSGAKRLFVPDTITSMFHLLMDQRRDKKTMPGLPYYRSLLLRELSKKGEIGEKIWEQIIGRVAELEQGGSRELAEAKNYPRTLATAGKVYSLK